MSLSKLAIDALLFKYHAEMKDATYVLSNYLNNPVALGEHPDLLAEMDAAVEKYASANERFETLVKLTKETRDGTKEEPTLFEGMD
jgi:predicted transcriptional regulator|tara:strand:+ start:3296 stop:3553 length:258 start_codon:yes stop_codon:yes gene_type:complete